MREEKEDKEVTKSCWSKTKCVSNIRYSRLNWQSRNDWTVNYTTKSATWNVQSNNPEA